MSEWHSIPAQFHPFKTVGNILLWRLFLVVFVFCCSLVSVVLCGLLSYQDLPQRVVGSLSR